MIPCLRKLPFWQRKYESKLYIVIQVFNFVLRFRKMNSMNIARQLGKYLVVVLFPAFVCLIINSSANRHYHILVNGSTIYHAHPYDKQHDKNFPEKSHHHTSIEFFLVGFITSSAFLLSVGLLIISLCRIHFGSIKIFSHPIKTQKNFYPFLIKRAPPLFSL